MPTLNLDLTSEATAKRTDECNMKYRGHLYEENSGPMGNIEMKSGTDNSLSFPPSSELFGGTVSLYSLPRNSLCGCDSVAYYKAVTGIVASPPMILHSLYLPLPSFPSLSLS